MFILAMTRPGASSPLVPECFSVILGFFRLYASGTIISWVVLGMQFTGVSEISFNNTFLSLTIFPL